MDDNKKKELEIQLNSLNKLLAKIAPMMDQAQDSEHEAKGFKRGLLEFISHLEQASSQAGYRQGLREGLEKYQKDLLAEIEYQQSQYTTNEKIELEPEVEKAHPDKRAKDVRSRIKNDKAIARAKKLARKREANKKEE